MDIRKYKIKSNYAEFLWAKLLKIVHKSFPDLITNDSLFRSLPKIKTITNIPPPLSEKQKFKILQYLILLQHAAYNAAKERQNYHQNYTLTTEDDGHKNARIRWNEIALELKKLCESLEKSWGKEINYIFQMPCPHYLIKPKEPKEPKQPKRPRAPKIQNVTKIEESYDNDVEFLERCSKINQFKSQLEKLVYFISDTQFIELMNSDCDHWKSELWIEEHNLNHDFRLDAFAKSEVNLIIPKRIDMCLEKYDKLSKTFKQLYITEYHKLKSKSPPSTEILHRGITICFMFSGRMFDVFCASSLTKAINKRLGDRVTLISPSSGNKDAQSKELMVDWTMRMTIDFERENHPLTVIWMENKKEILNFGKHLVSDLVLDGGKLADEGISNLEIILTCAFKSFDCCCVPNLRKNLKITQKISGQTLKMSFAQLFFHTLCCVIQFTYQFLTNAKKHPDNYLKGRKVWNTVASNPMLFTHTSLYILH